MGGQHAGRSKRKSEICDAGIVAVMQAVWKSIAPMGFQGATIDLKAEWHARTE
jgi:hypothetical protein